MIIGKSLIKRQQARYNKWTSGDTAIGNLKRMRIYKLPIAHDLIVVETGVEMFSDGFYVKYKYGGLKDLFISGVVQAMFIDIPHNISKGEINEK